MFLDAAHNGVPTVLTNLYRNFLDVAMRFYRHSRMIMKKQKSGDRTGFLISKCGIVYHF